MSMRSGGEGRWTATSFLLCALLFRTCSITSFTTQSEGIDRCRGDDIKSRFERMKCWQRAAPGNVASNEADDNTHRKVGVPGRSRGSGYGSERNSTIPTPEQVALSVGVVPTKVASSKQWSRAWRFQRCMLPILHRLDPCRPPDSSLNIACMWWKALAGNDIHSPVFDDGLSYDILPGGTRIVIGRFMRRCYPRLHHANVEMRTAYLDRAIVNAIASIRSNSSSRIRLVAMGSGYDLRSVKFTERKLVDETVELDLSHVMEAKATLLGPKRLLKRRPWLKDMLMPKLLPCDLNRIEDVRALLRNVTTTAADMDWHTFFVLEGVMIYLDPGVPSALLRVTSSVLNEKGLSGTLFFADRLENVPGGDRALGMVEMERNGWELTEWCPKPGLARHMGSATLLLGAD